MNRPLFHYVKSRIFFFITLIILGLVGTAIWEKYEIGALNESADTMYLDRLVPASEIFHLSNLMYEREKMVKATLEKRNSNSYAVINQINHSMDSIIYAYKQTYLVIEEDQYLKEYEHAMKDYIFWENQLLNKQSNQNAKQNFEDSYDKVRSTLMSLSDIQLSVGMKIAKEQKALNSNIKFAGKIKTIFLVVLTALIVYLIQDYRAYLPKVNPTSVGLN